MASVILNLAEGNARKSATERRRFFDISRASAIEVSACVDLMHVFRLISTARRDNLKPRLSSISKMPWGSSGAERIKNRAAVQPPGSMFIIEKRQVPASSASIRSRTSPAVIAAVTSRPAVVAIAPSASQAARVIVWKLKPCASAVPNAPP